MRHNLSLVLGALILWGSLTAFNVAPSEAEPQLAAATEEEALKGLPPGPGREAVYFACSACHSLDIVQQQALSRDEWDSLLDWMVETNGMHPLSAWGRNQVLNYLATHFVPGEDDWEGLPAGEGREDVFYLCQACHSLSIVKQQGLSAEGWDETLVWMVEEQGMPEPDEGEWSRMVSYLAQHYGIARASK